MSKGPVDLLSRLHAQRTTLSNLVVLVLEFTSTFLASWNRLI
jgi:hypothetical protein